MAEDNVTAPAASAAPAVGEKRSLKHELIDKLVILRMNLKFMIYCRGKHGSIGKVNEVQNVIGNDEEIYVNNDD